MTSNCRNVIAGLLPVVLLAAVVWHNLLGMLAGYYTSKWLGLDDKTCRTIAIEVGMQNSGLAVVLAKNYFSVMAALPAAVFSIWHNISGSLFATLFGCICPHGCEA